MDTGADRIVEALRTALVDNERLRRENERLADAPGEPVAIVAMSCRLPGGAVSPEALWRVVADGVDAVAPAPGDRGWEAWLGTPGEAGSGAGADAGAGAGADGGRDGGSASAVAGGFVPDATCFDPAPFGISPHEALAMDPQQRMLLEGTWEALERGGIAPTSLKGSHTGVFVGASASGYSATMYGDAQGSESYLLTGTAGGVLSGRLSYVFGLEGPAVTVDTACSSSSVALHLAVRSLRANECALAVAGGAAVIATPGVFAEFGKQGGLAADGRCKAFGADADGTGWAEGTGVLLLERLSDACRNGHPVLAVIRGTAVNQDGASNGLTAPSGPAQRRVIRQALADARLTTADVDAVEAHGTGTSLGDPIEARALLATYGQDRPADRPLWLGSLKSNLGHPQAAAGVAGVIKMVMALRHGTLPRTLHADEPSPHVDWSAGAVELLTASRPWPAREGRPRRAGVSSFGMSGTNVHLILEEAPARDPERTPGQAPERTAAQAPGQVAERAADQASERASDGASDEGPGAAAAPAPAAPPPVALWPVSGKTARALRAQAERLRAWLPEHPDAPLADVGYSLATTRTAFPHRAAVLATDPEQCAAALAALAAGAPSAALVTGVAGRATRPVFVFPGQGAQWAAMGRELLETAPVFAARLAECAAALAPHTDWHLPDVVRGAPDAPALDRVDVVQPVLWAVMVSLAELWRSYGVQPAAVIGHSQGEIAAAAVSGALTLKDAARVVALRSRALTALAGRGGMVSLACSADEARQTLAAWPPGRLSVAAVNGPASVVVSGDPGALDELVAHCAERDVRARRVEVDYASHSAHVAEIEADLARALAGVAPRPGTVPLFSSLTGRQLDGAELDAGYWYRNLRETVEFEQATRAALAAGHSLFLEISPHPVLAVGVQGTIEAVGADAAAVGTLRRDEGGLHRFLTSLAEAHAHGAAVDWDAVFAGTGASTRTDLPTYAFQRVPYWPAAPAPGTLAPGAASGPGPQAAAGGAADGPGTAAADEAFVAGLRAAAPAERHWRLLALVNQHAAAVLGHASADAIEDTGFLEQGFDSLTALRMRNNLQGVLGVPLSATLLFDHGTPSALARHLAARVAHGAEADPGPERAATGDGAAGGAEGGPEGGASQPAAGLLGRLFRHSRDTGRPVEYTDLLIDLASFRPAYTDHTALETPHRAVPLGPPATAADRPVLVSCCTMSMLSGAHEYARLAGGFRGVRDVYALPHPGFGAGQDLPADRGVLLRTHADTVLRTVGERPFVLTGHSGGAMVANVLSVELARQGRAPEAVVLMDSYPVDSPVLVNWIPQMLDGMVERDSAYTPMDDYRTTAWAAYLKFFFDWTAQPLDVPTLLVRAGEPLGAPPEEGDWRAHWPHPHDVVDVPGDHFTMLGDHSEDVAKRVQEWLADRGL
ncbi:acyltransferase domain-containing protein [Streptomyces sp. TRM70308]